MNGVTKTTFEKYDTDSKLNTLFDYIHEIHETRCPDPQSCHDRLDSLEKRKYWNPAVNAASGFSGGFLAVLTALKFKLFGG
jgi:hypothetical protein